MYQNNIVNQVGYHYRFVSTFQYIKQLLTKGVIGNVHDYLGEAYGPVVTRVARGTWRTRKKSGGGCLADYAAHVIDLVHYFVGIPERLESVVMRSVYSDEVEDVVHAGFSHEGNLTGRISVNWSEPSFRKMFVQFSFWGDNGKIVADSQECKIYLRETVPGLNLKPGWNVIYHTDLPQRISFYLRGEEYSRQLEHFVGRITGEFNGEINSFRSGLNVDETIAKIRTYSRRVETPRVTN